MSNLNLKLILQAVDRATAPVRKVAGAVGALGGSASRTAGMAGRLSSATAGAVRPTSALAKAEGSAAQQTDRAGSTMRRATASIGGMARATLSAVSPTQRLQGARKSVDAVTQRLAATEEKLRAQTVKAGPPVRSLSDAVGDLRRRLGSMASAPAFDRIAASADRAKRTVGNLARGARTAVLLTTAGATAAAIGLWSVTKAAATAGDEVFNSAQKIGVGVEALQRLNHAAKLANSSPEELGNGLKFLAINARAAAEGSKDDVKSFAALGVKFKDLKGKLLPVDQVLMSVADRFAAMPDGVDKTALAVKLFGRSGVDMIPLLNMGAKGLKAAGDEAERFGLVMTAAQAAAGDDFNDNLDRAHQAVLGLKIGIGNALLPVLGPAIAKLTEFVSAHRPEIIAQMTKVVDGAVKALPKFLTALNDLVTKVDWPAFAAGVVTVVGGVAEMIEKFGGIGNVVDIGVAAWIAKLVFAIGGALVPVLVSLGVATIPIWLTIAAIAALAATAYLIYRNWGRISAWFAKLWADITSATSAFAAQCGAILGGFWNTAKATFSAGVSALWNLLPQWFRGILTGGASFALKIAANIAGPPTSKPPAARAAAALTARGPGRSASAVLASPAPSVARRPIALRAPVLNQGVRPGLSSAAPARSAAPPAARPQPLTGKIEIVLSGNGQAHIKSARTNAPDLRLQLSRGPVVASA